MEEKKVAMLTGILGQDASTLAEFLLEKGYVVRGIYRRASAGTNYSNIQGFKDHPNFELIEGSITDHAFMTDCISKGDVDEWFNLAGQSHVGTSFKIPVDTFRTNAEAVVMQLELIKTLSPNTKYYQASTSEMFGGVECPAEGYDEKTKLHPRSPYAVAKVAAHHSVRNYREGYGLFACSGILFNHSSTRRGSDFATRKITKGVANIASGFQKTLSMGNMEAFRDEGSAKDYVKAMWLMLQQSKPDDYVIATGEGATIREMLEYVCSLAGLSYDNVYEMNEKFMRPSDVPYLKGDPSKAKQILGWKPEYSWKSLLKEMYEHDLAECGGNK